MIFRQASSARRSTADRVDSLPAYIASWQRQRLAPHLAAAVAIAAPQSK